MNYSKHVSTKSTPQTQPVGGKAMVANSAGGYGFNISPWSQLERFLLLGCAGGSFYADARKMTLKSAEGLDECLKEDALRAVKTIVDTSVKGLALSNEPAIFALAYVTAHGVPAAKQAAYDGVAKVCRTGTHLFHFCQAIQDLRGWSRGLRSAVSRFYTSRGAKELAYQLIKYRQRDGWAHRDALRMAHPKVGAVEDSREINSLLSWAVGKTKHFAIPTVKHRKTVKGHRKMVDVPVPLHESLAMVNAFEEIQALTGKTAPEVKRALELIAAYRLPWEALPTELHKAPEVWETLAPTMPLMALIRNLGRMSTLGILDSKLNPLVKTIMERLVDVDLLRKSRMHPISVLKAVKTYGQGHGDKGSLIWQPVQGIQEALEAAFYASFKAVEPTGQNWLLALDVSGSMGYNQSTGMDMSCAEVAAVMAMVTARIEASSEIMGFSHSLRDLGISSQDTLQVALKKVQRSDYGGTDCALPVAWALAHPKARVDTFAIYTDGESWAGHEHVFQTLKEYRSKVNAQAKLIAVSLVANEFSIADPSDPGMLDVVGMSPDVPQALAAFSRQKLG